MTTNPNHQSQPLPELSDQERQLFDIQKIAAWRMYQYGILNGLREANNFANLNYGDDFNNSVDSMLDDYLGQNGINQDSLNYSEIRQLFYDARIGQGNGNGISESEWGNSPANRGIDPNDHKRQRDVFTERINDRLRQDAPDTLDDPDSLTDAEREERDTEFSQLEKELENARELMATENAKRQGRLFSVPDHDARNAIQKDYEQKLHTLGRRHLAEHEDYDDDEKNLIAMTILFDEQEKLRERTTKKLEDKKVTKIIKWMNKGKWYTRIGKGVGIGAAAGLAGTFLAGAVGAGIIAGGAVAATRFARGFALKDHDKRGMASFDNTVDADTDVMATSMQASDDNNRLKKMDNFLGASTSFEMDTQNEQKKRRKAALYGIGSMAIGAFAGYGIHQGVDALSHKDLTLVDHAAERTKNFFQGNGFNVDPGSTGASTAGSHIAADASGHTGVSAQNHSVGEKTLDWTDFSKNARYVHPGEGWYETFQDLGISQDHWADVLKDAGPKLHEQGWAYFDSTHGEWRISHSGNLSQKALETLAAASRQDGFTLSA